MRSEFGVSQMGLLNAGDVDDFAGEPKPPQL